MAQARVALARVHRHHLVAAEAEARVVCDLLRAFPAYRPEVVALWSRILAEQGRTEESLKVCEKGFAQNEALALVGSGLLDLYTARADALIRCGKPEAARPIVERALSILRQRTADLPDAAMRAIYLQTIPEHVRLLALAAA